MSTAREIPGPISGASDPTIDLMLEVYKDTHKQLREACWVIPDERMAEQFPGLMNHPAWTLSHLWLSSGFVLRLLGVDNSPPDSDAMARFGPGSTPIADVTRYEARDPLLSRLEAMHMQVDNAVRDRHREWFGRESPEFLRQFSPTIGRIIVYLVAAHESYHLGQLMLWKKAAGLGSAGGK